MDQQGPLAIGSDDVRLTLADFRGGHGVGLCDISLDLQGIHVTNRLEFPEDGQGARDLVRMIERLPSIRQDHDDLYWSGTADSLGLKFTHMAYDPISMETTFDLVGPGCVVAWIEIPRANLDQLAKDLRAFLGI
jgi:hypothetical protein